MKYSIGYQLPDEFGSTSELCEDYSEHISDVYFAWGDEPSGRFTLCSGTQKEKVCSLQLEELKYIKSLGKTLTLLFNANCYGENATSHALHRHIISLSEYLKKETDIDRITTTSPFIAQIIKENFGNSILVNASVNMRIGSVCAMEQLADYFDGYYVCKEVNRNFSKLNELKSWCDANGKTLNILANSGCLNECAFQTFHDNLIAHQTDKENSDSMNLGYSSPCQKYLAGLDAVCAVTKFMQSNWIRPEDVHRYEKIVPQLKLATRMHSRPRMVLAAYVRGQFKGNLLDLTEPSYSRLLKGNVLDNTKIPDDWFEKAVSCQKDCHNCSICKNAVECALDKYDF